MRAPSPGIELYRGTRREGVDIIKGRPRQTAAWRGERPHRRPAVLAGEQARQALLKTSENQVLC